MKVKLNTVNPFRTPLEIWSYRRISHSEAFEIAIRTGGQPQCNIRDQHLCTLTNLTQAAKYMAAKHISYDVSTHITNALKADPSHRVWRQCMPAQTPQVLIEYQNRFPPSDFGPVNAAVRSNGVLLPEGQVLVHGGAWPVKTGTLVSSFTTNRVFATTFCPQIALLNAIHSGKAQEQGYIDLMVLTVTTPQTPAFVFNQSRGRKKHEKEILFGSGATLTFKSRVRMSENYPVGRTGYVENYIPVFVIEAEIS